MTELYTLDNVIIHSTFSDKAVRATRGNEEWWFPLSQVKEMHHMEGRIVVTAWIAKKKGLI